MKYFRLRLFFFLLLGVMFSTAKTQNYDSIVSKIYEYNDFSEADTVEGSSKKALGDWMRFYEDRLDENGDIGAYVENLNAYYQNNSENSENDLHWESISRVETFHFNSYTFHHGLIVKIWADTADFNHILAGTEFNGLWETYDNGDNWICLTDNEPRIKGISSLEVLDGTIYIATASHRGPTPAYTQGLFYSSDHGSTWQEEVVNWNGNTLYPSSNSNFSISQWLHHPENTNIQFLLMSNYLFRSNDNGNSFEMVFHKPKDSIWYSPWKNENIMKKIIINPNNTNELFVSGPELLRVSIPQVGMGEIIENMSDSLLIYTNDTVRLHFTDIGASKINPEILWFSAEDTYKLNFDLIKYNDEINTYDRYHTDMNLGNTKVLRQLEVSPFSDSLLSIGGVDNVFARINENGLYCISRYAIHIDVRASKLYDNDGQLLQILGTDGGIGKISFQSTSISYPFDIYHITNDGSNGIINYNMTDFDVSTSLEDDMMLIAQDHNGVAFAINNEDWESLLPGMDDGKSCNFRKSDPEEAYAAGVHGYEIRKFSSPIMHYGDSIYGFQSLRWNDTYNFMVSPINSEIIFTGEYGSLWSIECSNVGNIDTTSYPLGEGVLPLKYAARDYQNFLYLSTNRKGQEGSVLLKFEYNIYNGNLSFEKDMSEGIKSTGATARITSIALDPFNTSRFWVSLGGTGSFPKIWLTEDDGLSFTPYAEEISDNFPINELLFDEITKRLFAVNDIGIFYYDTYQDIWKNITGDLPPIYCNFIRFSPDHTSLRLGSKSRGPWEASLCLYEENNPIHITSNELWEGINHIYSDVYIFDSAQLTITDTTYITKNATIHVLNGGKLILNSGKITSLCNERWQGIEVADGGIFTVFDGVIENAEVAIRNYLMGPAPPQFGGDINLHNSTFLNNRKVLDIREDEGEGVWFYDQEGTHKIIINNDYLAGEMPDKLITIKNSKITAFSVSFQNTNDLYTNGTAIYSNNSKVGFYKGEMNNFLYGLYLNNNANKFSSAWKSTFNNIKRPIYANNCNNLKVSSNNFSLPTYSGISQNTYGVYLEHCTDYEVEDNLFIGVDDGDGGPPEEKAHIGLYINNSGAGDNLINNNTFENINYATVSYGHNKGEIGSGTGLCYKCNTFIDNSNDIRVLKNNQPNPGEFVPQGIAENQGANIPLDPSSPAGNQFSYTGPTGSYSDINNKAEHFTYYYHANQQFVNLEPQYYSEKTVTTVSVFADWNVLSCDPDGGGGGGGGGKAAQNKSKADSVQNFITLIEDGGNPENLRDLVANSLPSEAYQVYTALMQEAPEISDTTMAKAIEKEEVLAPVMIRDIMAANPKSSKSDELIGKLEERNQPLPDYMLGQILQGRSLGDFMTDLYAKRSYYTKAYHQGIEAMVSDYLADSLLSPIAQLDSALCLLEAQEDVYFDKHILAYTAAKADYAKVQTLLGNQLSNPKLLDYQEQALEGWQSYYQILASITEEEPDSTQLIAFSGLWLDNKGAASAAARSYLQTYGGLEYEEPLYLGDEMYANGPNEHYQDLVEKAEAHQYLEIYPNPAKDYLIVKFDLEQEYSDALIKISNLQGVIIDSKKLEISKNQILIPTKDYPVGNYTLQLIFGKQARETHKFTVIH